MWALPGALERFLGGDVAKLTVLTAVATECEAAGQIDWALELYTYADRLGPALRLVNQQLADILTSPSDEVAKGGQCIL